ncbi:tRNA lysidine(34) synthetase TilS [Sediminimonas qiaohouensis]|uniref:tRNA lysidine(34) synthetase TilS n=1 Tax=Sediminimonas qiaohouensis TaxID=552061 RepID=UPI000404EE94|nr:tRNA lysidine(34) synthetase TilS [Sediminimonas qiaohouensis]
MTDSSDGGDPGAQVVAHFRDAPPAHLGVAVSGGSDSVALLRMLADWAPGAGVSLHVVTVDHGLRPESADEARAVAALAAQLGAAHDTLHWRGWDGTGNVQDAARQARYRLIRDWALARGIGQVALGHTGDDQAETVLMALARGAGVDGMAAMPVRRDLDGVTLVRPMLGLRRAALRRWLEARGQDWADDPGNEDPRYDRIKARRALEALAPLGVDAQALARVAGNMAEARAALRAATAEAARDCAAVEAAELRITASALEQLPSEIARRLLIHALHNVGAAPHAPRRDAIARLREAIAQGRRSTLAGCLIAVREGAVHIGREPSAVAGLCAAPGDIWDRRWRVEPSPDADNKDIAGTQVAALGEAGLAQCPDPDAWRKTGLAREAILAAPAVWRGDTLLAAPVAGWANGWRAVPVLDTRSFAAGLLPD